MMRPLRLLAVLALTVALLFGALHPPRFTHAYYHNALCICPACLVTDGPWEASVGEYC